MQRMDIGTPQPAMYKAMIGLDRAIGKHGLPQSMVELVKLRASQINGCVYCVDMHSTDARKAGESDVRLHGLVVWPEAGYYTEDERAALALTESMTRLSDGDRVPATVWDEARTHFDDAELAVLVMAITMINAWNRVCVTTRMTPENGIELS